ncbi:MULTISPECIES: lipopolysaccharide transport periplasmic protein LptA [Thiomicrorhabdus]|uniref:Lipopolysaccharide export system protein LptA n=1 Tax=Thiomicrorhabdus heinhorstiae TaxID=2748010 RepID=A0ABS0BTR5_9GAMM|nr:MULTISPECIES: lipopolysaccharide transport periplasmic protein LptA [Thiomicrorhabdus]MBF6057232.1 lipopolysaccharide transport periplasmic protein LptA [Thiomicrorhabdus heinhorstiae]
MRITNTFLLCLAMIFSQSVYAADKDESKAPVQISADSLQVMEQQGTSIYQGQVKIKQGSFELSGDEVIVKHPNNQLKTLTAKGKPANFQRYIQEEKTWVKGQAEQITYDAKSRIVTLTGNASVEQSSKHRISGPELIYDIEKQTLQANSSPSQKQRISVTLTPDTEN